MPRYTVEQFAQAIPGTGGVMSLLAHNVGCDWHTAKKYVERHPTLTKAWEAEQNKITDKARHNIVRAIKHGDLQMSKWWLQVKDPEFRETRRIEGTGDDGAIILSWGDDNARPVAGPAPGSSDGS